MQTTLERPVSRTTTKPLTDSQIRESVALALEGRAPEIFTGIDGIEHRRTVEALNDLTRGTIFAAIGDELSQLGIPGNYATVGGVMTGMGFKNEAAAHKAAHAIGCDCHGVEITAEQAAERVRQLI